MASSVWRTLLWQLGLFFGRIGEAFWGFGPKSWQASYRMIENTRKTNRIPYTNGYDHGGDSP
jgi:hypothetical protein